MPPITEATRKEARRLYEMEGMSLAKIAVALEVNSNTVGNWKKKNAWGDRGGQGATVTVDTEPETWTESSETPSRSVDEGFYDPIPTSDASVVELQAQVIELQGERDDLRAENEKLKPTINVLESITNRVAWLTTNTPEGDRYWLNRAEAEFKKTNQARVADNLPPFDIKDFPEMLDDKITELKAKEAAAYAKEPSEPPSRKVKLAIYRGGEDAYDSENGVLTIEQIPLEGQINNTAGSLADGIVRYTRKGFRLTEPFLCPRAGCFRPAATDDFNRWAWDGYCTERHRNEVEVDQDIDLAGVIVRDHGVLSGAG